MTKISISKTAKLSGLGVFLPALMLSTMGSVHAQDAVPDQNIRLPSVSEYTLPPGENNNPAPAPAEGPVAEGSPPPAPTPQPGTQPAPSPAAPSTNQPAANQPTPTGSAPTTTRAPTSQRPAPVTRPPVRSAPDVRRTTSPSPSSTPVPSTDSTDGSNPEEPAQDGALVEENTASTTPDDAVTIGDAGSISESSQKSDQGQGYLLAAGLGLAALLAGLIAFIFWQRRREEVEALEEESAKQAPTPDPAKLSQKPVTGDVPIPAPLKKPAAPASPKSPPKIYSPPTATPATTAKPTADPAANNGFITTKVGLAPNAAAPPPRNEIAEMPPTTLQSGNLQIEFVADKASSTLMNAVVGYQLIVTNKGKAAARDLEIFADLVQADQKDALHSSVNRDVTAHKIESLKGGDTLKLSGDIKLPLNQIQPISANGQALFIPLARLNLEYIDYKKKKYSQAASYIVGQEHQPPRPKMAPFRLDLGPRNFGPVGQRPVQV